LWTWIRSFHKTGINDPTILPANLFFRYLMQNCSLKETNRRGYTILHMVCDLDYGSVDSKWGCYIIHELLQNGADATATTNEGETCLHLIVGMLDGNMMLEIVCLLIQYGCNSTNRNLSGATALDLAKKTTAKYSLHILSLLKGDCTNPIYHEIALSSAMCRWMLPTNLQEYSWFLGLAATSKTWNRAFNLCVNKGIFRRHMNSFVSAMRANLMKTGKNVPEQVERMRVLYCRDDMPHGRTKRRRF
jgi:hypothetical protein